MLRIFRGERRAAAPVQPAQREQQSDALPEPRSAAEDAARAQTQESGRSDMQTQETLASPGAEDEGSAQSSAEIEGSAQLGAEAGQSAQPGAEPGQSAQPGFLERGRMRRRARFLCAARELAYRDLGGLVFDLHRFKASNEEIVNAKLRTLGGIDSELRVLEQALGERRPVTVLREAGVAACPRCAAIHGSGDRFCPTCGLGVNQAERPIAAPSPPPLPAAPPSAIGPPHAPHPNGVHAALPAAPASAAGQERDEPTEVIRRERPREDQPQRTVAFDPLSPLASAPVEAERGREQDRP